MVAQTHLHITLYVHCLFYFLAGLQNCSKPLFASSCLSALNSWALTEQSFHEFGYCSVFRKSLEKIQASLKSDQNAGTVHEDL